MLSCKAIASVAVVASGLPCAAMAAFDSVYAAATVRQTRPVLALGIDYRVTDRWSLRGEWSRYFGVGDDYGTPRSFDERGKFDLDLASVGLTYRF
jgi:hypothetical protein